MILIMLVCCGTLESTGQTRCNCKEELSFLKNFVENNYAGFADKVNAGSQADYQKHTDRVYAASGSITNSAYCIYLMNDWLSFFKDGHLQIRIQKPYVAKPESISLSAAQKRDLIRRRSYTKELS